MISIVIVNFNTKEVLRSCLRSVEKFIDLKKNEVIVVDNGSKDGSVEMVRNDFKFVNLIVNVENVGFAIANNQGIKIAKGDYILLLNSDTELLEKRSLEKLVEASRTLEKVGAVVPRLLNPDKSIQESVFYLPTLWGAIKRYWLGKEGFGEYVPILSAEMIEVEAGVMAMMLIPFTTIDKVGLLDEGYHMYYEDLDYCRRIKKAGLKVYYIPDVEIVHHCGASGKKLADGKDQWRRLIPGSKRYHGWLKHFLINFVLWSGQNIRNKFLRS